MKNKYQRMNKEEKIKIKKLYLATKEGRIMIKRLERLLTTGIAGVVLSLLLWFYSYYLTPGSIWDYISTGVLFIISTFFIIMSYRIKVKVLNKEALKKK